MAVESWALQHPPSMPDQEFVAWQRLLDEKAGLQLNEQRRIFLETSLTRRMRELGLQSYEAYYNRLLDDKSAGIEWLTLIDRLTVKETQFFRHQPSFEFFAQAVRELLSSNFPCDETAVSRDLATSSLSEPQLQSKPKRQEKLRDLHVWSVGCATGEEAYSLAMTLDSVYAQKSSNREAPELHRMNWSITATDISLPALSKARGGVYPLRKTDSIDLALKARYFTNDERQETATVVPELKERICFAKSNVTDMEDFPIQDVDIIFCQNVLIYFNAERKDRVLQSLASRLSPGGLMVLGVGEVWTHPSESLRRVAHPDVLVYRRLNEAQTMANQAVSRQTTLGGFA